MTHSVRLRWVARLKRTYLFIQRIAEFLRHVVIEPKSSDDCRLGSKLSIPAYTGPVGNEANDMLGAPITARGNAVNYQIPPFSQVNKNYLVANINHSQKPSVDLAKLNAKALRVEPS